MGIKEYINYQVITTLEVLAGRYLHERPREIVDRTHREWALNERFQALLQKHGKLYIPPWKNVFIGNGRFDTSQHWKLDTEVSLKGKATALELWAFHPLGNFDVYVGFPEFGATLAMAPRGKRTNPLSDDALRLGSEILLKVESRLESKS